MKSVLVGYKKFVSKKNGNEYCVANVLSEFSEREKSNGCVGKKIEEVFLPKEQVDYLTPDMINKEISMEYELSGGRAYLVNVTVK